MIQSIDLGLLILRLVLGFTLALHGAQKLVRWWGGPGLAGWTNEIRGMNLAPARFWAVVSMGSMLGGGLFLALGLLTPLATAALVGPLIVIILRSKRGKGFWNLKGGWEYPLLLLAGVVTIALTGPGAISLDNALGISLSEPIRVLVMIPAIVGGLVAVALPKPAAGREGASAGL